jgi:hypothetical protein
VLLVDAGLVVEVVLGDDVVGAAGAVVVVVSELPLA